MSAERDTNISPLSRVPPEFNRSKSLLITGLAQPSLPTRVLLPQRRQRRWQRSDPKGKKGTCSSGSSGEAAMPGLWQGWRGEAGGASPAGTDFAARRQRFWGCNSSIPPLCLSTRVAFIAIKQQGAFPSSFPRSRDLLLTLIAGQAPCSQLNPLLGQRRIPAPRIYCLGWKSTGCLTSANPACASTSSSARGCWVSFARGKQVSHRSTEEIGSASPVSLCAWASSLPGAVTAWSLPSGSCLCSGLRRRCTSHF